MTKIQSRILERLESGRFDGLPAEVFVRGFVRSFARCVGLDEDEALRRYGACGSGPAVELTPTVRALVDAMVDLAPGGVPRATPRRMTAVHPVVEIIDLAASSGSMRASGAVVETMMLPETGTVVMPVALQGSFAEPMADGEPVREPLLLTSPAPVPVFAAPVDVVAAPVPVFAAPVEVVAAPVDAVVDPVVVAPVLVVEPMVVAEALVAAAALEAEPAVVAAAVAAAAVEPIAISGEKKKRSRRGGKRSKRASSGPAGMSRSTLATGTPYEASPVVAAVPELAAPEIIDVAPPARLRSVFDPPDDTVAVAAPVVAEIATDLASAEPAELAPLPAGEAIADEPIATATWSPKMPPIATTASVPWRRPAYVATVSAASVPSLVIDDADPDSAERVLEERAEKHTPRRSFLPPILLDREDRSGRQGGLTLAVIILLIAATLTLSYLMRRPSAGGDGMTQRATPARVDSSFLG